MLLALHAGTAWGIDHASARGFMLAHFGLFLLWQPLWRGERSVSAAHGALVIGTGLALAATAGWWVIALWLAMMFGLLGGRATGTPERRSRLALLLAAAYVLTLLLAWVVPQLFSSGQPDARLAPAVQYGLPLLPLAILFVPAGATAAARQTVVIDLFYAALLFLLVVVLVLGSFVLRDAVQGSYGYALVQMLFGLALLLAVLSWLWNPHAGYAGLQQLVSRYVAGIGLPFERWIAELAALAAAVPGSRQFMERALEAMLRTARVGGVSWRHGSLEASRGSVRKHSLAYDIRGQHYLMHLNAKPAPGMALHLKLLAETLAYFYEAKRREERERDDAYQRAIHETGARLTHDVKNLLQALRGLCAAAEEAAPEDDAVLLAMLRRQLPALAERVGGTLDRLRKPRDETAAVSAAQWWDAVQRRHGHAVVFRCSGLAEHVQVPGELFDGVAENLIVNALRKSQAPPAVQVSFDGLGPARLEVRDNGAPVPAEIARDLLLQPVPSATGLGVGLYHCAQHAARLGYRLTLARNRPGDVAFVLEAAAGG